MCLSVVLLVYSHFAAFSTFILHFPQHSPLFRTFHNTFQNLLLSPVTFHKIFQTFNHFSPHCSSNFLTLSNLFYCISHSLHTLHKFTPYSNTCHAFRQITPHRRIFHHLSALSTNFYFQHIPSFCTTSLLFQLHPLFAFFQYIPILSTKHHKFSLFSTHSSLLWKIMDRDKM